MDYDPGNPEDTSKEPLAAETWKMHIIMACTVAAAVEMVLVIFIILYWRQIRWTLRKISCPCVSPCLNVNIL